MYKADPVKKGIRCTLCTGCGRCEGVDRMPTVVTKLGVPAGDLHNEEGVRLAAVDIGTTTIAMQLYDADGKVVCEHAAVNPQRKYGADVLSRIQAAEDKEKALRMREAVQEVLAEGFGAFRDKMAAGEKLACVIAANTTMKYLLLGYDPAELGRAPFTVHHAEGEETVTDGVVCRLFPSFSAFVGGDIAAGILASELDRRDEITLFIDLGTNGEIVIGNRDRVIACATAAGPAFEGGPCGSAWGADMVAFLARLREAGILDETGLLADPYFEEGVRIGNVTVTEQAVRALQLAKGAVAAGIEILTRKYGITCEQIDRVVLAGGFGYYLNPADAAAIGLIPEALCAKCVSGGNTALAGAMKLGAMMIRGEEYMPPVIEVINLAEEAEFEGIFLERLGLEVFPNFGEDHE